MLGPTGEEHLPALGGARGLAALAVFACHLGSLTGGGSWVPGSFLAVDLFLLSGFVVAKSYDGRLRGGAITLTGSIVFLLALVALASASHPSWATRPPDHLGRLSHALHILHAPVVLFVAAILKLALGEDRDASPARLASCCVLAVVGLSALATYLYDEPARARLRRPRRSRAGGSAAPAP